MEPRKRNIENSLQGPGWLCAVRSIWSSLCKAESRWRALSRTMMHRRHDHSSSLIGQKHDDDDDDDGASPNSHKHFFPYMGFCASIWGNVRHHCHRHHHHHHIQKSKSINTEACLIAHWLKLRYGLMMQAILGHAGDFITVWKKEKSTRPHGNPLCFPKNIFCLMWCNWKRMAVLESA